MLYKLESRPTCNPENVIQGEKYRISILTEQLVRFEYSEDGIFEDRATQVVLNRDFPKVEYTVKDSGDELEITTNRLRILYDKKEFSERGLGVYVLSVPLEYDTYHVGWRYGWKLPNFGGTTRTLDQINGACEIDPGIMSPWGAATLDDSKSVIINDDGFVSPRKKGIEDFYFFGYAREFDHCLRDFYYLTGKAPMIPRYALGNWWSRYYKYTEETYMELIEGFEAEKVPLAVSVIDMDWHEVDIDPKYGSGWTGYTWNKKFFPDPERFMKWLHDKGMKITLNLHPADGVRGHEEAYEAMALAMGVDPKTEEPIEFDITDEKFMDAYFKVLHHPMEEQGVDFWWMDWQQGALSKMEGLDPLWMLNHFHYLDNARDGKRPMTFSRYSGPGSHRYPIGFSGDTHMTWESLAFQPYFTATATNIGYGWWSHDIGGHMQGYKDEELATRWIQFGVFSPIMRLHASCDIFNGKEPWNYRADVRNIMDEFLRLRHKMIPYTYTMNYKAYKDDMPMIRPIYYLTPENWKSLDIKDQYCFGDELIVAPITSPMMKGLNCGKTKVWLPEGLYFDIFTGMTYRGNQTIEMYRKLETIPVLAKAGAIVPFTEDIYGKNMDKNPDSLVWNVFAGADGEFELYEDDNVSQKYMEDICVKTKAEFVWDDKVQSFTIHKAVGELSLIPEKRTHTVKIWGVEKPTELDVPFTYDYEKKCLSIELKDVSVTEEIIISFKEKLVLAQNRVKEHLFNLLNKAEIPFEYKNKAYYTIVENDNVFAAVNALRAHHLPEEIEGAVMEILLAY